MAQDERDPGFATLCIHGKKHLDKHEGEKPIRAVSTPIFQSSTFAFENVAHGAAVFRGEDPSYVYTRLGNPTQTALETEMAYLEKGEAALALASGMAAATTAVLTCCQAGDHIVAGDTLVRVDLGVTVRLDEPGLLTGNRPTIGARLIDWPERLIAGGLLIAHEDGRRLVAIVLVIVAVLGFLLFLGFSRYGRVRLGPEDSRPERFWPDTPRSNLCPAASRQRKSA